MSSAYHTYNMHYELKLQYAWELIMLRYGRNYADNCVLDRRRELLSLAKADIGMTPEALAKVAMEKESS